MHRTMSCDATEALPDIVDTAPYDRYIQHSVFSQESRVMAIVRDRKSALLVYPAALPWIGNWSVESSASGRMRGCSYHHRSSSTPGCSTKGKCHVTDILLHHRRADGSKGGVRKVAVRKLKSRCPVVIRKLIQHRGHVVFRSAIPRLEAHIGARIHLQLGVHQTGVELCQRQLSRRPSCRSGRRLSRVLRVCFVTCQRGTL
jgi:hypothetical protein